jgi:hypothetical protein
MDIDTLLDRVVNCYLFGDLQAMANVIPQSPDCGGVGYPMVATTLSGIELLGNLLLPISDNKKRSPSKQGNHCFLLYWDDYVAIERRIYRGLGRTFRQLVRHGVAHTYAAKGNVIVFRGTPVDVRIERTTRSLAVDCIRFAQDFERSYTNQVRPIVDGTATNPRTTKAGMQQRLDELESRDLAASKNIFEALPQLDPSTENGPWPPFDLGGGEGPTGAR